MFSQVRQFSVQTVMTARPQPVRSILAISPRRPQVQFDGQLQVVNPFAVVQEDVQFAQRVPASADRQVGRQQGRPRRVLQGKLP
ncbi:hypothetical protein D3C78_1825300 [compost metagenome]